MIWRLIKNIVWAMIFWMMFLFVLPSWGQTLLLKDKVFLNKNVVKLSDIVIDLNGTKDVTLFSAPSVGDVFRISAEELKRILVRKGVSDIELKGQVEIYHKDAYVSAAKIQHFLEARLASTGYCLDEKIRGKFLLPKDYSLQIKYPSLCSGTCYAYLIVNGSNYHRKIPVRIRPNISTYVWVVNRDILPGEILSRADVIMKQVRQVPANALAYNRCPVGYKVKYPVKKGSILSAFDIVSVYLVKCGDRVRVVYDRNGIHVEVEGVARQNGKVGDLIPVRTVGGAREILARVVKRDVVEVER